MNYKLLKFFFHFGLYFHFLLCKYCNFAAVCNIFGKKSSFFEMYLNAGIAVLGEGALEELVELSVEDSVSDELT